MSNDTTISKLIVKAWVIRHVFRKWIWLGRKGQYREFPLVFATREDAVEQLPTGELERGDWEIVAVSIMELDTTP